MSAKDRVNDARPGVFWMNDAIYDYFGEDLGVYGVAIYGYLCRRANSRAQCWPSLNGIAKTLKVSRSKVVTTLDTLERLGLISRSRDYSDKGGYTSTVYTLHDVSTLVREVHKGSTHNGQGLVHDADPKEVTSEGSHIEGTKKNPKKKGSEDTLHNMNLRKNHKKKEPKKNLGQEVENGAERRRDGYEWFFK